EAEMQASESMSSKVRQQAAGITGGRVTVEVFEQMTAEVGDTPPAIGNLIRLQRIKMDPARIDDNVAYFKAEVLPRIKATPGFRAVRNLMNRATGEGVVGTVLADQASLDQASKDADARRAQAAERGVELGDVMIR